MENGANWRKMCTQVNLINSVIRYLLIKNILDVQNVTEEIYTNLVIARIAVLRWTERTVRAMDRLTQIIDGQLCTVINTGETVQYRYGDDIDKLAAYEDTGLTPEEVEALKADNDRLHRLIDELESGLRKDGK